MSFRRENADAQTEFRRAALENGYTPLPNDDKRCMVKGWGTLEPTPEAIEEWSRKLVYQATGLRVENGLCAIDVDIDDSALVERLWERAVAQYPQLRDALVRFGSGDKELWLCRTDEPFSVIFSTLHVKPGVDPEEDDAPAYRLEAFGGGHTRQIGAFGAHTMRSDNRGFKIEYTWADDESPAEVRLDALPLLPKAAVLTIAQMAGEVMGEADWPRVKRSKSGESDVATAYDLTDDMRFDCLDGHTRSLDQLASYAATDPNARCSASWMGDPYAVNRTRCLLNTDHDGTVSLLETANWARHKAASLGDRARSLSDKIGDLREKLEERGFDFDHEAYHDAPASFQDVVFDLLENWAWCGSRGDQCLPIYRGEDHSMTLTNLRLTHTPHSYEREGPNGGVKKINPVDAWLTHSQRQDVDGYRFMPDQPPGVFAARGERVRAVNSYHAPVHERVEDAAERALYERLWVDFINHLLPQPDEREWFLDWLAHKKQNLTVPGVGIIMYAGEFGVGRGSLFELIGSVFGQDYVNSVSADLLMGTSSQGQYTDWLANALFVTTDEVLPDGEEGTQMGWRRKKAYEKLKERIDPKPRRTDIIRKGHPNYQDWVYASFLLATNHDNAIPIPRGDRRLVVLTNNITPLARVPDLLIRLNEQRNPEVNPRFASVIADWLDARDVSHFNAHVAPEFSGKSMMQEANITELEAIVDDVLEQMPYEWATMTNALRRIEDRLIRLNVKDEYPNWRRTATDLVKMRWFFAGRARVGATREMIYARTRDAVKDFEVLPLEDRDEQSRVTGQCDTGPSRQLLALRKGLVAVGESPP